VKILTIGDSPRLKTGFGKVNLKAIQAFQREGHEVAALEGLYQTAKTKPTEDIGIRLFTPDKEDNQIGSRTLIKAYEEFKPDLVYLSGEPGILVAYMMTLPGDAEVLTYQYIEGEPIVNSLWLQALGAVDAITPTEYGAKVLAKSRVASDVPWVYSGVDHDVFNVTDTRDEVRKNMGFDDKFVIMCAAQNVRRKQLPRLLEAVAHLKYTHRRNNIALYLHTVPFQHHWLEGWNLLEVIRSFGIEDEVYFHPSLNELHSSIPERTDNPAFPGLVELYNAADLFVLPSQVEGFGLPIAEAMACGVPVVVTKYAAGWEVAQPAGKGLIPHDWEIHKSGTRYANVDPKSMADVILKLIRNPRELARMREAGLARVQDFQWSNFQQVIATEAARIDEHGGKARDRARETSDQIEQARQENVGLREAASQEVGAGSGVQP
jgi:glycosyltransferase involved in cell wall biosynthesis